VVLMRGHGDAVVGPSLQVAVFRAIYTEVNANLQIQATMLGGPITADIIEKVNADVQKIVSDPEFQKNYLERFAVQPVPGSLDVFAEYLRKDSAKWGEVIKAANVKIE
jgi:Tripartite tricarboxylate transporter family receptor